MTASPGPRSVRVSLRVTPRAILELGNIYPNPESVVKEFIQNAIDANARTIWITVNEAERELVIRHDGEPITGEYLEAFLTVGTDFKAKKKGMIGMYGIGRLSWTMIGEEAWIRTGDKILYWSARTPEDLMNIEVREADSWFDGVEWRIKLKNNTSINPGYLKRALSMVYYGSVPVYVNGEPLDTKKSFGKLLIDLGDTKVYLDTSGERRLEGAVIKGIFKVGSEWAFQKLVVVTESPSVKINSARIIVRDAEYEKWKEGILEKLLSRLPEIYPNPADLVREVGFEALKRWHRTAYWYIPYNEREARNYLSTLVFETGSGGYVYGSVVASRPEAFVYSTVKVDDSTRIRVMNKGYEIIYVDDEYDVKEALKILGVKRIEEIMGYDEARILVADEDIAGVLRSVVSEVKNTIQVLAISTGKTESNNASSVSGSTTGTTSTSEGTGATTGAAGIGFTTTGREVKVNMVNVKFVGSVPDTPIVLVELDNTRVVAFTDGSKIFVNVKNEENIKRLELTRKLKATNNKDLIVPLWAPVVAHEILHMYGLDHTDPMWGQIYERVIRHILINSIARYVGS